MSEKTYTELDIKEIYAQLIDQMGHDAGTVCNWSGYDTVSLDDWKKAWWEAFNDHCKYEQECATYNERKRIAAELLKLNEPKY